jgi:hypothetical protein
MSTFQLFVRTMLISSLIEVQSAVFKGLVANMLNRSWAENLPVWVVLAIVLVLAFLAVNTAMTLHFYNRFSENLSKRASGEGGLMSRPSVTIAAAVAATLFLSVLFHIDERALTQADAYVKAYQEMTSLLHRGGS